MKSIARLSVVVLFVSLLCWPGVADAGPIVERLIAVRRGYCESPEACSHCTVPCNRTNLQECLLRH